MKHGNHESAHACCSIHSDDATGKPAEHHGGALGVPVAAGVLYPFFGVLLSPIIASAAMSISSVSVIGNALRLRGARL